MSVLAAFSSVTELRIGFGLCRFWFDRRVTHGDSF
jgi:hypothetical protein